MKNPYLKDVLERIDLASKKVLGSFGFMTLKQLNWKPTTDSWSIGQCLDHIIVFNKSYLPTFIQLLDGTKRTKKREKLPLMPDVWGNYFLNILKPSASKRIKTPQIFEPSAKPLDAEILDQFVDHQSILMNLFLQMDKMDHDEVVITSPTRSLVTYTLRDTCRIIITHEERHIRQALAIKDHPKFPGDKK